LSSAGPIGPSALEALEILKSLRCQMENEDMDPTDVYVLWSKAHDLFAEGVSNLIEQTKIIKHEQYLKNVIQILK